MENFYQGITALETGFEEKWLPKVAFLSLPRQKGTFCRLYFSLVSFSAKFCHSIFLKFRFTSVKVKVSRTFISRNWGGNWGGFVLVCYPDEQGKVFSFPGCHSRADGDTNTAKSYTEMLPQKSGRSLALNCICIRSTGQLISALR